MTSLATCSDILGAAVILFQLDHLHVIIIFLELQDILDGSAAETINALGIIPYHANIFMTAPNNLMISYCAGLVSWYSSMNIYLNFRWYLLSASEKFSETHKF